jgi:(p)ppGpp synthase/HD superfamily hydrolase
MEKFSKLSISLRYYLIGKGYNNTLKAWNFAEKFHTGFRKDGVTPEIQHQIEILHFLRTMPVLPDPDTLFSIMMLHDTMEDYGVSYDEIDNLFGNEVAKHVRSLSKTMRGVNIPHDVYYSQLSESEFTSIGKGADRAHNVNSMVGVFTNEKQLAYIEETENDVFPMLKTARRLYPEYENTFENIKHGIKQQLFVIKQLM